MAHELMLGESEVNRATNVVDIGIAFASISPNAFTPICRGKGKAISDPTFYPYHRCMDF
jgi:hypothetical protein